jgi:hypothetical protein
LRRRVLAGLVKPRLRDWVLTFVRMTVLEFRAEISDIDVPTKNRREQCRAGFLHAQ